MDKVLGRVGGGETRGTGMTGRGLSSFPFSVLPRRDTVSYIMRILHGNGTYSFPLCTSKMDLPLQNQTRHCPTVSNLWLTSGRLATSVLCSGCQQQARIDESGVWTHTVKNP